MGREEDSFAKGGYEDRIIDIDIVEFGSIRFYSQKLMIPHLKHLNERDFSQELLTQLNTNIEKIMLKFHSVLFDNEIIY